MIWKTFVAQFASDTRFAIALTSPVVTSPVERADGIAVTRLTAFVGAQIPIALNTDIALSAHNIGFAIALTGALIACQRRLQ